MSKIFIAVICFVTFTLTKSYSQNKNSSGLKNTSKQQIVNKNKVSSSDEIKAEASKWFKNNYVENNFKDKYSYKLMSIEIAPVLNKVGLVLEINELDIRIKQYDSILIEIDKSKKLKLQKLEECIERINRFYINNPQYKVRDSNEIRINQSKCEEKFSKIDSNEIKMELVCKNLIERKKEELNEKSLILDSKPDEINYYLVKVDAYAKNSFGNLVLGKYLFMFKKKDKNKTNESSSNWIGYDVEILD